MRKQERARDIAIKAITIITTEDEALRLMWRGIEDSKKKTIIDKIATFAAGQIEEYAGSIPMEPQHKVILIYPDWISDRTLFLKNRQTGALDPVKIVYLNEEEKTGEQKDAVKSPHQSEM